MKPLIIVFSLRSVPKSVVLVYQSFKFVLHYKIKFLFGINILKLLLPIAILLLPIVLLYAYFNQKTSIGLLRLFEMTQRLIDKLLSITPIKRQNATEKALCIVRLDVVGDYILTRNFFAPFKEYYKDYKIVFIGNSIIKDLSVVADSPYIDEFIFLDHSIWNQ